MTIDINTFVLSNSLNGHPVCNEKQIYKEIYFNILEYFSRKYSSKNNMIYPMLKNYKKAFNVSDEKPNIEDIKVLKKQINEIFAKKYFKKINYRYCLICDLLFINAFNDEKQARQILDEIKEITNKKYHKKLDELIALLFYNKGDISEFGVAKYQIECWLKNKQFLAKPQTTILITANMSAGKSTLINALVGKIVNKTMNEACTSKIHYIYDQAFEDNYTHEWDYEVNLNADSKALLNDDERNTEDIVMVATHFNMFCEKDSRLCIIDTPGVNSSTNTKHAQLTKKTIVNGKYDLLVYVLNADQIGTDDEYKYLSFISENVPKEKVIFVLNKLDKFNGAEDSVNESVENLRKEIQDFGFDSPIICPISSYAGLLAKKVYAGNILNEDESDEYTLLVKKLKKENYKLSKYYNFSNVKDSLIFNENVYSLLLDSGLCGFQNILLQRRNAYARSIYKVQSLQN